MADGTPLGRIGHEEARARVSALSNREVPPKRLLRWMYETPTDISRPFINVGTVKRAVWIWDPADIDRWVREMDERRRGLTGPGAVAATEQRLEMMRRYTQHFTPENAHAHARWLRGQGHGAIYVLHMQETSFFKVGFSMDVEERIRSIQTSAPTEIVPVRVVHGTLQDEKRMHRALARFHVRGEWFRGSLEEIGWAFEEMNERLRSARAPSSRRGACV